MSVDMDAYRAWAHSVVMTPRPCDCPLCQPGLDHPPEPTVRYPLSAVTDS